MTVFEYEFVDGRRERVKASYYKKERNPRSDADEYVFYEEVDGEDDRIVKIVPVLWLDFETGSPKEVA